MDHDYRTCDCDKKINRMIELASKQYRTDQECEEMKRIKEELEANTVFL